MSTGRLPSFNAILNTKGESASTSEAAEDGGKLVVGSRSGGAVSLRLDIIEDGTDVITATVNKGPVVRDKDIGNGLNRTEDQVGNHSSGLNGVA